MTPFLELIAQLYKDQTTCGIYDDPNKLIIDRVVMVTDVDYHVSILINGDIQNITGRSDTLNLVYKCYIDIANPNTKILHMLKAKIDNLLNMRTIKNEEYNFIHVNQRLRERHGLSISLKEYKALNKSIVNKELAALLNKDDSTKAYATSMISKTTGKSVAVIFNPKTKRVETVLP